MPSNPDGMERPIDVALQLLISAKCHRVADPHGFIDDLAEVSIQLTTEPPDVEAVHADPSDAVHRPPGLRDPEQTVPWGPRARTAPPTWALRLGGRGLSLTEGCALEVEMRIIFGIIVAVGIWLVPSATSACGCCDHDHGHHAAARTSAGAAQLGPGEVRFRIPVSGMHCGHCASRVETALQKLNGVKSADASYRDDEVIVVVDKSKVASSILTETIDALGFKAGKPAQM